MKGCLRAVIVGTGLLLIAVAVAALLLVVQADTWLRSPMETALTAAAGAPCRVEALHFRPLAQSIEIRGISLTNGTPESGMSLKVDSLVLFPDPQSVFTGQPALRRVTLKGARMRIHVGATTDLGLLLLGAWSAKSSAPAAPPTPTRWAVRELTSDSVILEMPDALDNVTVPAFTLGGANSTPLPPGELVRQFMRMVITRAVAA